MAIKTIFIHLFVLLGSFSSLFSQAEVQIKSTEFIKELKPVVQKLNADNFSMKFKKEIFKDKKSNELISSSFGTLWHGTGREFRSQNDGITVIQTNEINVVIDSAEHLIQIAKTDSSFNPTASLMNFNEEMLKTFVIYRLKEREYTVYKLIPSNLSEGIVELYLDNQTQHLYKLIITYPLANYFSEDLEDETLEEPFAVIIYEPLKQLSTKEATELFDLQRIIQPTEKGRYKVTEEYSEFEIYDSRYTTN